MAQDVFENLMIRAEHIADKGKGTDKAILG